MGAEKKKTKKNHSVKPKDESDKYEAILGENNLKTPPEKNNENNRSKTESDKLNDCSVKTGFKMKQESPAFRHGESQQTGIRGVCLPVVPVKKNSPGHNIRILSGLCTGTQPVSFLFLVRASFRE